MFLGYHTYKHPTVLSHHPMIKNGKSQKTWWHWNDIVPSYSVSNLVLPLQVNWGINLRNIVQVSGAISQPFLAQYGPNESSTTLLAWCILRWQDGKYIHEFGKQSILQTNWVLRKPKHVLLSKLLLCNSKSYL